MQRILNVEWKEFVKCRYDILSPVFNASMHSDVFKCFVCLELRFSRDEKVVPRKKMETLAKLQIYLCIWKEFLPRIPLTPDHQVQGKARVPSMLPEFTRKLSLGTLSSARVGQWTNASWRRGSARPGEPVSGLYLGECRPGWLKHDKHDLNRRNSVVAAAHNTQHDFLQYLNILVNRYRSETYT